MSNVGPFEIIGNKLDGFLIRNEFNIITWLYEVNQDEDSCSPDKQENWSSDLLSINNCFWEIIKSNFNEMW